MHDFIRMILEMLQSGILLGLFAVGICTIVLFSIYFVHRIITKGKKKFPWWKALLILLMVGYLSVLIYATVLRSGGFHAEVNLHLFRSWREAWNNYSLKNWMNVILNIAMFVPFGMLLPLLVKAFRKCYLTIPIGFLVSLAVETIQLVLKSGFFDIDDLFTNTLGTAIGFCIILFMITPVGKVVKRKFASHVYMILPVAVIAVLTGITIKYDIQEFGNMPQSASFMANTDKVEFMMKCELSDSQQAVPVYHIEPFNKKTCEAFASEFAANLGITYSSVSYYDNSIYFANHSTGDFLTVEFFDRSYWYRSFKSSFNSAPVYLEEETLREQLKVLGIHIPQTAQFSHEENGNHIFRISMEREGDILYDGTITCRCAQGDVLEEVRNELIAYTYYRNVDIISEKEAYEEMVRGNFFGGDRLEKYGLTEVTVTECRLEYRIDTKGFYQPVYVFVFESEKEDIGQFLVPARL